MTDSTLMRIPILILATGLLCAAGIGQNLRRGVADAELVVIARVQDTETTDRGIILYQLEVLETLKGQGLESLAVLGAARVADQPKPSSSEPRLYCLRRDKRRMQPSSLSPIYRMLGYQGANPKVDRNNPQDPILALVNILVAAEDGVSLSATCDALFDLVIERPASPGIASVRREAIQTLRERPVIAGKLSAFQMSNLLSLAVAETEDIPLKIGLASLCAERRMKGVIGALCISLDRVGDPRFTLALGRMARVIHAEAAAEILQAQILKARSDDKRARLLHALGATQTQDALTTLLRYRKLNGPSAAINAALTAHGSKQAMAAVEAASKDK